MNLGGSTRPFQPIALLNCPSMLGRNGNPFSMDGRNRNALLQKINNPLGNMKMGLVQFPPPRLQSTFPGPQPLSFGGSNGVQQSLNMLCDVAVAGDQGVGKRTRDDLRKPEAYKRRKTEQSDSKDNPVLLQRLTAMGGGFPMPKWGAGFMRKSKPKPLPPQMLPKTKLGAFPMPALKDRGSSMNMAPSLSSYKALWRDTDLDLREEVLARKLERGRVIISQGKSLR
jgi:hypothetical protein